MSRSKRLLEGLELGFHLHLLLQSPPQQDRGYRSSKIVFLQPLEAGQLMAFALASCVAYASPPPIMKFLFVCLVAHGWKPHRWATAVNVKLLLPPRQSRGNSHFGLELTASWITSGSDASLRAKILAECFQFGIAPFTKALGDDFN